MGDNLAGVCKKCGGPVFHRDKKPGEYNHNCFTYFKGDKAIYTGKKERLYGGNFAEIKMLEGHNKGKLLLKAAK